jgi:hypothetical protein
MTEAPESPRTSFVNVPVPEDLVEAVYAFIASVRASGGPQPAQTPTDADANPVPEPAEESPAADEQEDDEEEAWDDASLRELAHHPNPKLRALLLYLSERPDQWIPIEEAMPAAGVPLGRAAGGWFSRLNRSSRSRYRRELPIGRDWQDGRMHYYMDKSNADVLLSVLQGL